MFSDNYIIECVSQYFSDAETIMVIGSHSTKTSNDLITDIDILITHKDYAFNKGFLAIDYNGIKVDFTIIPSVNFENFLLYEYNEGNTGIIYCLKYGKIIKDYNNKLAYYKEFATFLFDNRKNLLPFKEENFFFKATLLSKLAIDYKNRKIDSIETFIIFTQIVEVIMELELILNTGWSCAGKIKGRILSIIDPFLIKELMGLIKKCQTNNGKKEIQTLLDHYLDKYAQLIKNNKFNAYDFDCFYDSSLIIEIFSDDLLTDITNYCEINFKPNKYSLYALNKPYFKQTEYYNKILVIKANHKYLDIISAYLKIKRSENIRLLIPAKYPLIDVFNGGKAILNKSEELYSFLFQASSHQIVKSDKKNLVALNLLLVFSDNLNLADKSRKKFYEYLVDSWLSYSYDTDLIFHPEIKEVRISTIKKFEKLFFDEKKVFIGIFNSISSKDEVIFDWQKELNQKVATLQQYTINCKSTYIPKFEIDKCNFYNKNSASWYIFRKQLEVSFLILGINRSDWSYFAFIIKMLLL